MEVCIRRARHRHGAARGLTLVELLIALCVMAILLGAGLPAFQQTITRNRSVATMIDLRRLLEKARTTAITRKLDVMLCGTMEGDSCTSRWGAGPTYVFIDKDGNRRWSAGDERIAITPPWEGQTLWWRGSGGRSYLRFSSAGGVREYGTFTYCPLTNHLRHVRQIAVNSVGRNRDVAIVPDKDPVKNAQTLLALCPP